MSKIAITGATGFIGSYLVKNLDFSFRALTREPKELIHNLEYFAGDLASSDLTNFLGEAKVLIHLVNQVPAGQKTELTADQEKVFLANTSRLFQAFKKHSPQGKIIFASTGGEMYDENINQPQKEELAKPCSAYAFQKIKLENELSEICRNSSLQAFSLRIGNPFWYNFEKQRQRGLVPVAIQCAFESKALTVTEHLDSTKDYFYMPDLLTVFKLAINEQVDKGINHIFNVGSGNSSSITSVVSAVEQATDKKISLDLQNHELKPKYNSLDISKIKNFFGWNPDYSMKQGIEQISNSIKKDKRI